MAFVHSLSLKFKGAGPPEYFPISSSFFLLWACRRLFPHSRPLSLYPFFYSVLSPLSSLLSPFPHSLVHFLSLIPQDFDFPSFPLTVPLLYANFEVHRL